MMISCRAIVEEAIGGVKQQTANKRDNMNDEGQQQEKYPWAGPLLFATVLMALVFFFKWFLSGG